jgi:hypothetical protein
VNEVADGRRLLALGTVLTGMLLSGLPRALALDLFWCTPPANIESWLTAPAHFVNKRWAEYTGLSVKESLSAGKERTTATVGPSFLAAITAAGSLYCAERRPV